MRATPNPARPAASQLFLPPHRPVASNQQFEGDPPPPPKEGKLQWICLYKKVIQAITE